MNTRVLKYEVFIGPNKNMLPFPHEVLTVQQQGSQLVMWVRVPEDYTDVPMSMQTLWIVGTGWTLTEDVGRYITTLQQQNGALVWHCFEGR